MNFDYADYDTAMSDGTKQIVVQFQTTSGLNRIAFGGSSNGGVENRGIRDIIIHKETMGEGYACCAAMSKPERLFCTTMQLVQVQLGIQRVYEL